MVREKDVFWEYVEELNGRFLCKFCERSFAGGITRIKSHLSGIRGRDIEICQKVPEDVQIAAHQAISTPNKKIRSSKSSINDKETEIISSLASASKNMSKSSHQPNIQGVCERDKSIADKMFVKFILTNNLTLDLSEKPFLLELFKSIAKVGPTYELPNSSAISSQALPGVKKELQEYILNVKNFFTTTGCTLAINKVVKSSKIVCMKFFVFTPGGLLYIEKITVPEEGMTFDSFIDSIYRIIESLGPQHVVQIILDDSEDQIVDCFSDFKEEKLFLKVMENILMKYPWIFLSRCANGELGMLLILIYLGTPWIHKTTQLAKVIFKYLYEHDIDLPPKKEHARNKFYKRRGLSKIAIEFFILNSILGVEKELQALQLPLSSASREGEGSSGQNDVSEVVHKAIHSTEFWSRGNKVVQVLRPLLQVLELTDYDGSTSGYLYEAMKSAEEAFEQHLGGGNDTMSEVFNGWRNRVVQPIHEAAAFFNPAYLCRQELSEVNKLQKVLDILMLLVPVDEQETLSKQVQLYRMKVPELFTAAAMKMLDAFHPRKWWECFGDPCPLLQKYAIRILSQTCTASLCDHCKYEPDSLVDDIWLNIILMEKFSEVRLQNSKLIELGNRSGLPEYSHEVIQKFFEDPDWSDPIDHYDLLEVNPNDRNPKLSGPGTPNDLDDLFAISASDQNNWNIHDDFSDMINQYLPEWNILDDLSDIMNTT